MPGSPERALLRHLAATLAYRAAKVLRDVPEGFAVFESGAGHRTPVQIVAHLGDLMTWAVYLANGEYRWAAEGKEAYTEKLDNPLGRRGQRRLGPGSPSVLRATRGPGSAAGPAGRSRVFRGDPYPGTAGRRPHPRRTARPTPGSGGESGASGELCQGGHCDRPSRSGAGGPGQGIRRRREPAPIRPGRGAHLAVTRPSHRHHRAPSARLIARCPG